jgi:hypothetical protein
MNKEDMQPGAVPMPFLVGANRHFGHVRAHRAFAEQQLDV